MNKIIIFTFLILALVSCGGSGGGASSGASDTSSTGSGSTSSGGSSGGNGNASYYGYTSNGTLNSDIALPSSNTTSISNDFYMKVVEGSSPQALEVGVYQPTCLLGASNKDYAMVLMSKGSSSESTISMRVTSSGITTVVDAYDQTNNFKTRYGATTSTTGTCTNGKMTLTNGDVVFSNGNFAIYKKGTDLYVGMSSSITLNSISNVRADIQLQNGAAATEYYNTSGTDHWSTANSASTSTTITFQGFGQYTKYLFSNNTLTIDGSYSIRLTKVGGFTELIGVQGLVGTQRINMFVAPTTGTSRTTSLGDSNGATLHYSTFIGASALYMSVEN